VSTSRAIARFDAAVDGFFERRLRGRPTVDRVFYSASALGDFSLIWHLLGAARGLRSDRDAQAAVRLSACLGVEAVLVNGVIKGLIPRTRPTPKTRRPFRLRSPKTTSFPSGHASAGFTAATLITDAGGAPAVWYPLAAVVGFSRVHVSIHHASDVVAGAIVGVALGQAAKRAWPLPDPFPDGAEHR
jgi:membrane-associated phospholipid phosphatase